jgi:hypothetical protein
MFSSRSASALSFLLVLLWNNCQCSTARKDRNSPHPHRGTLRPYNPGPFENMKLSRQDESTLNKGESVTKQTMPSADDPEAGGGVLCIQDVDAPKAAVWNQILDLDSYEGKVSKVNKCKNYFVGKNKDGSSTIKTKMVLGVMPGYSVRTLGWLVTVCVVFAGGCSVETHYKYTASVHLSNKHHSLNFNSNAHKSLLLTILAPLFTHQYESYYDHTFYSDRDSLTWNLDYDKTSDFDDVAGHWHVEDHPSTPGRSRVFYACDIKMKGSVPKPILNYISKAALKQATGWVKRESERFPDGDVPAQYAGAANKMSFGRK